MSRRQFVQSAGAVSLTLLAGCAPPLSTPLPAAQIRRIARLAGTPPNPATDALTAVFRQAMRDLGYVEGQNLVIEERYTNGDDQLAEPAAELMRLQTEVFLVPSIGAARAVRTVTTTIPIVSAGQGDLVATGLAASLARPGGNVTGLSAPVLAGKQLQILQEAVPTLSRVAVLLDTTTTAQAREPYETAARSLGLQLAFFSAGGPADLAPAFDAAAREHADGLFVAAGPMIAANQARIAELGIQHRLPSMWGQSDAVGRGGLLGYAPNRADLHRRAATYVVKILQGSRPADLPVQEPTTFDFSVNLKTAQDLGLAIPYSVLQQATEIIQ